MRRSLLVACAVALLLPLSPRRPAAETSFRLALRTEPDTLDPAYSRSLAGRTVLAGLCDRLFDLDPQLALVPQLALGHEWADTRTLVLHLREGVAFQDGEALDAEAVKYSLERNLSAPGSLRRGELDEVDHVEIVDPRTVRIVLREPSATFLGVLADRAGIVVAPRAAEAEGKDFGAHPVCAGPFRLAERTPGARTVLERFPDYWNRAAVHLDRVLYLPMPDGAARAQALRSGAVDMAEQLPPAEAESVRNDPSLRLVVADGLGYAGITLNLGNGDRARTALGQDPRVRKALELSLDRELLIAHLFNGQYAPTAQAVPADSPFHVDSLRPPARDVARARVLLKEAGLRPPVPVALTVADTPEARQAGEAIRSMAAEAGFDVKVQPVEFTAALRAASRGDFEAFLVGWSGRPDPDGNIRPFLHSGGALNDGRYANAAVDELIDRARSVTDPAQRRAFYEKLWQQVSQDDPILYLWTPKLVTGLSARVSGYAAVPDGVVRLQGVRLTPASASSPLAGPSQPQSALTTGPAAAQPR